MRPPTLAIVIVNWNGGELLTRCLGSIRAHARGVATEVLVIDNASSDGSRERAAELFPEFRVINSGSNLGFGRANNLTRGLVTAPAILFLNPDAELMPGALERALECLDAHPEAGAIGCRMLDPEGHDQGLGLQWSLTPWTALLELLFVTGGSLSYLRRWLPVVDPARSGHVRKLYGGCLLVRREVMDAAGWFDERYFMYAEDADLSRTILALGWRLYYCAESVILHVGGGVTAGAPSTFSCLMMQESVNKLIAKYHGRAAAVLHRAAVLLGGTVRLVVVLATGLVAAVRRPGAATARWRGSLVKQQQLVLWSLGLRRAAIPDGRQATGAGGVG